jgi:glycosyltransferase involved in cell wall biosynthesis
MVYASADRVIVLSEAFASVAERDYGVPSNLLRVIPGAADLERFAIGHSRAEARAMLGWPTARPILLTVRRLVHRTGVDLLIDALPAIIARVPDVLLCIGGTGTLLEPLKERVASLGIERHVMMLGYVADAELPLMYRAADINVVPTRSLEGFGLTVVEALAAGTPTMVTPVGGLPEIVSALSPALVFRSNSVADIAEGLIATLTGAIRPTSEAQCRSFALARFSAETMAGRVADVYKEVCADPRGAAHVH